MNEQTKRHLDKLNHLSTEPELVGVVQYDEGTKEAVLLLAGQTLSSGDFVEYGGKKFPVVFNVESIGDVPDEVDHSRIVRYISTEAWDKRAKTIVTTSEPVYGTKAGRTVYNAKVSLSVGGVDIPMSNEGLGSRVVCTNESGNVVLRRWAFIIPATVWGFRGTSTTVTE